MGDLDYSGKKTDWKRVMLNYDAIRAQPADSCLFCLNRQQQMALIAILEPLGWKTRWYSPTNATIDTDWLEDFVAQLEAELMTDHCDLQTAIDNINTNITTINSTLVTVNADITTINNDLTIVQNNLTLVQNNVTNIYNQNTSLTVTLNIPDQTFSSDSHDSTATANYARYNAFCKIVTNWMLSEAAAVINVLGGTPTQVNDILLTIDSLALSLWANLFAAGSSYTPTEIHDAFLDSTALNDVACAIITALAPLTPTYLNFKAMLFGYSPAPYPDHHAIIADTILNAITYLDGFNAFMSLYTPMYQEMLALNPTDYYCPPCGSISGCALATYDFSLGNKGPWVINRGTLVPGFGIIAEYTNYDPANVGFDVSLLFPGAGCSTLIGKHLKFTANHLPTSAGNANWLEFWYLLAGVPTKYNNSSFGPTNSYPGFTTSGLALIPAPPGGAGIYRIRWYVNTPYYGNPASGACQASTLQKIEVVT